MNDRAIYLKRAKIFAVLSLICFASGSAVYVIGYEIAAARHERAMAPAHEQNAMSTVFAAAQLYITEYCDKTGEIKYDVTCDDLVEAGLLSHNPEDKYGRFEICVVEYKGRPCVDYVKSENYTYPVQ